MSPIEEEINERLLYLAQIDDGEIDNALHYARLCRAAWLFESLPIPIKIGLYELPVALMMLAAFPPPPNLPWIALPIVWAAAYCVVLVLVTILPHRYVKSPEVHWV